LTVEDGTNHPAEEFAIVARPSSAPRDVGSFALRSIRVPLLAFIFGCGLLLFLLISPPKPWILLLLTGLVAAGADGIFREQPRAKLERDVAWTAPLLFLPTMMALSAGLFLEEAVEGYWLLPAVAGASVLMAAILYAENASIDEQSQYYPAARFMLNVGTFLTGFGFYVVVYAFEVSLVPAAITVGLVSMLLAVEVLREAEGDPVRELVFAAAIGVVVAEARWALYFLPLESYLAGVFLLLVFYVGSGLIQHHIDDDLSGPVIMEFSVIATLGVVIVALGRIFETSV